MLRILEPGDYFGTTLQHYSRDGIAIAETRFATDLVIPPQDGRDARGIPGTVHRRTLSFQELTAFVQDSLRWRS